MDVRWVWYFVKRRFWLITTTVMIGTAIAAMIGLALPVLYTATAEVVIEPTDTRILGLDADAGALPAPDAGSTETQINIVRSRDVAAAVVDLLGLERRMALQIANKVADGATLNSALQPFAQLFEFVPTGLLLATGLASEVVQLEAVDTTAQARRAAFEYLARDLNVRQKGRSQVLTISFTEENPSEASRVANAFADTYIHQQLARKIGGTTAPLPSSKPGSRNWRKRFAPPSRRSRTTVPTTT